MKTCLKSTCMLVQKSSYHSECVQNRMTKRMLIHTRTTYFQILGPMSLLLKPKILCFILLHTVQVDHRVFKSRHIFISLRSISRINIKILQDLLIPHKLGNISLISHNWVQNLEHLGYSVYSKIQNNTSGEREVLFTFKNIYFKLSRS